MFKEKSVTIAGFSLTEAQVTSLRCAVTDFFSNTLSDPEMIESLGPIGKSYRDRCREVLNLLLNGVPEG